MIDVNAKPAPYLRLLLLVTLLGVISAVVTFVFIFLVHNGTSLLWEQAANTLGWDPRIFTLLVCTIGGLLVGLLVKFFGDHNGIFAEMMLEFGKTGRFNYRNSPGSWSPPLYRSSPGQAWVRKHPWRMPAVVSDVNLGSAKNG